MSDSDVVVYVDPCVNAATITRTLQTDFPSDDYSGRLVQTSINPFTVTPSYCKVNYECNAVRRQDNAPSSLNCNNIDFPNPSTDCHMSTCRITKTFTPTDYENGTYTPGCYDVEFCGTIASSASSTNDCATVELCLVDPCDPPTSFSVNPFVDQFYSLYDKSDPYYITPSPVIVPSYCLYRTESVYTRFRDFNNIEQTAVLPDTFIDDKWNFEWLIDDSPLG